MCLFFKTIVLYELFGYKASANESVYSELCKKRTAKSRRTDEDIGPTHVFDNILVFNNCNKTESYPLTLREKVICLPFH